MSYWPLGRLNATKLLIVSYKIMFLFFSFKARTARALTKCWRIQRRHCACKCGI